jgi:ABC-type lipoprotein export system ATPase subunit
MTADISNPIIQAQDVTKVYETGDVPFTALNKVALDIFQGDFLIITGRSGAGKTTLLNMLSGVDGLTSGSILFQLEERQSDAAVIPVHSLDEDALARWRGANVGIVYQSFELMPSLTLLENVMLPSDFSGGYQRKVTPQRALELLELVELAEHAHKIPAHVSGGQKQRVAIARALVNDPHLILADEPTGNLDSVTAETIFGIFEKLVEQGKTVVMVTHDESLAARASRRLVIADGVVSDPRSPGMTAPSDHASGNADAIPPRAPDSAPGPSTGPGIIHRPEERAVILRNVDKVYENAAGRFNALKSIDLELNYGQFVSVIGRSGCGKSTLLNMITGIDHPTAGDVVIGGEHIYRMSESQRALWRGRNLGIVFQFFQLLPTLSLLENTVLPMDYCNLYPFNERPIRAMQLLKLVGLEEQAHSLPGSVSSGQQQEAAIARALATDPSIVVADEPTGNLDSRSADNILDLFEGLARAGKTVLIVTHDPHITRRTDQTIILSDGEIIDPAVARALPFLSHPAMLAATRQAVRQTAAPGELILTHGAPVEHLFMIVSGGVDVYAGMGDSREMTLAHLAAGQFFGEIELTRGGHSIAGVRAAEVGAELALLPRSLFDELMSTSPPAQQIVTTIAAARLAEHSSQRTAV